MRSVLMFINKYETYFVEKNFPPGVHFLVGNCFSLCFSNQQAHSAFSADRQPPTDWKPSHATTPKSIQKHKEINIKSTFMNQRARLKGAAESTWSHASQITRLMVDVRI
jgi:hypothetical protein